MSRLYIGHLPARCDERDIEKFFKGYGRLRDVVLKNGYGFVEFYNDKDAEDAVYDLHGREMGGERIIVQHAKMPPGARGGFGGRASYGSSYGGRPYDGRERRFGPPTRTEYRVIVDNVSSRVGWQDLKDLMRNVGEVSFTDVHKKMRNSGIVEFTNYDDVKEAIKKYDGYEWFGRRLKLYEDGSNKRSRSNSRGRSRSSNRRGSRYSRSRSGDSRESDKSSPKRRDRSYSSRNRSPNGRYERRNSQDGGDYNRSRSGSLHRSTSRHSRKRSSSDRSLKQMSADRSPIRPSTRNGSDNRSAPRNRSRSGSSSRSRGSPSGGLRDRASPSSAAANSRESSASPSRRRYDDGDNGEEHHSMDSGAMEDQADD